MGGGMLRTVGRAVGAGFGGVQDPFSASTCTCTSTSSRPTHKPTSNLLSLSSTSSSASASSSLNLPVSATFTSPTWPSSSYCFCGGDEWELKSGDGIEGEKTNGFSDKFDFGPVPSKVEVENAVSALQQVLSPAAFSQLIEDMFPSNWDKDVADQTVYPKGLAGDLNNPRILRPHGSERVYDAFHLLLTDSSVQRMVMSLSSDKAVWDAVLNNHVVRELKESLSAAENNSLRSSDENYDVVTTILRWILDITRANIMEFIEKITKLVNEVLRHPHPEGENSIPAATDLLEEKMRSSFLLSILVFIIVVLTRFHKA